MTNGPYGVLPSHGLPPETFLADSTALTAIWGTDLTLDTEVSFIADTEIRVDFVAPDGDNLSLRSISYASQQDALAALAFVTANMKADGFDVQPAGEWLRFTDRGGRFKTVGLVRAVCGDLVTIVAFVDATDEPPIDAITAFFDDALAADVEEDERCDDP